MNKTIQHLLLLGLVAICSTACVTQKKMTYLRDADPSAVDSINAHFHPQSETVIRSGDALTVVVSALDKEAVAPYNSPALTFMVPGSALLQTTSTMLYYVVSEEGDVDLPVLGKVKVAGLKRAEVEQKIQGLLEKQVLNPMVHVDLVDAKVTVLGEVAKPGKVDMKRGRLTILEALAEAGDLTPFGRRENVLITREVDGKLEIARLDLGSIDLYTSPYYYLQQNDVVYVSPNQVRVVQSTNVGLWLSMVSTVASAATVIVTVVSVSQNNKK
jgi:polysaccharide export outer membrane protein